MEELLVEGIVLRSTPFKEKQCIIAVLTKEFGLLSFIGHVSALTGVLSRSSFLVRGKNKEGLLRIQEAHILDNLVHIRENLAYLTAAGKMAKLVLDMQAAFSISSPIYVLLQKYLENLGKTASTTLWVSFALKLLNHEGLLNVQGYCACGKKAYSFLEGEIKCYEHHESFGIVFSSAEWDNLALLCHARHFEELQSIDLSSSFIEKIELSLRQLI